MCPGIYRGETVGLYTLDVPGYLHGYDRVYTLDIPGYLHGYDSRVIYSGCTRVSTRV